MVDSAKAFYITYFSIQKAHLVTCHNEEQEGNFILRTVVPVFVVLSLYAITRRMQNVSALPGQIQPPLTVALLLTTPLSISVSRITQEINLLLPS